MPDTESSLYRLPQVAELLDCSVSKVRKMVTARQLDSVRYDRYVRVPKEEVDRIISENRISRRNVA